MEDPELRCGAVRLILDLLVGHEGWESEAVPKQRLQRREPLLGLLRAALRNCDVVLCPPRGLVNFV